MSNPKISADMLKPNTIIFVEGDVTFSRITRFVEGKELEAENHRRATLPKPMLPASRPYTTIAIANAKIVPMTPGQLTLEEQYVQSKFYVSKNDPNVLCFSYENKSPYLPRVSQVQPNNPNAFDQIMPEGELANGLHVMLLMNIYQAKNFGKNALGLDQIVCKEPIRYYNGSSVADALAKRGMSYTPLTPEQDRAAVTPKRAPAEEPTAPTAAAPAGINYNAAPAYTAAPTPAPTPVNYTAAPAPAPAAPAAAAVPTPAPTPAPTAPAMNPPESIPQPASPWVCETCGMTMPANSNFCNGCGAKRPDHTATANATPYGGIVYEPNN